MSRLDLWQRQNGRHLKRLRLNRLQHGRLNLHGRLSRHGRPLKRLRRNRFERSRLTLVGCRQRQSRLLNAALDLRIGSRHRQSRLLNSALAVRAIRLCRGAHFIHPGDRAVHADRVDTEVLGEITRFLQQLVRLIALRDCIALAVGGDVLGLSLQRIHAPPGLQRDLLHRDSWIVAVVRAKCRIRFQSFQTLLLGIDQLAGLLKLAPFGQHLQGLSLDGIDGRCRLQSRAFLRHNRREAAADSVDFLTQQLRSVVALHIRHFPA